MTERGLRTAAKALMSSILSPIEPSARTAYLAALHTSAIRCESPPSRCPAIVFAPHPDDETIGCGGTIVRKRRLGAPVTIVFMTDGAASRPGVVQRAELKAMRRVEAVEAASVLGVGQEDLVFLDYPDGELADWREEAAARISAVLSARPLGEIYVPYRRDVHRDHVATNEIVRDVLARQGEQSPTIFEYPVWFLRHWPLVGASSAVPWRGVRALRLLREFRMSTDISEVVDVKLEALSRHRSQMRRGDPQWPSIAEDADGRFLPLFFREHELFCCGN